MTTLVPVIHRLETSIEMVKFVDAMIKIAMVNVSCSYLAITGFFVCSNFETPNHNYHSFNIKASKSITKAPGHQLMFVILVDNLEIS